MTHPAQTILAACDPSQQAGQVCQHVATGPGAGLRIFVIVSIVGLVLLGWLLLRGYQGGASADSSSADSSSADSSSAGSGRPAAGQRDTSRETGTVNVQPGEADGQPPAAGD